MDILTLKNDFYKRFEPVNRVLYDEKCGMLYNLLGFYDIYGAKSLNTALAPYIKAVGCVNNTTNIDVAYSDNLEKKTVSQKNNGAQLLISNIYLPFDTEMSEKACICKLLKKLYGEYFTDIFPDNANIESIATLLDSKVGYCTMNNLSVSKLLPLPLSGYNLIYFYPLKSTEKITFKKIAAKVIDYLQSYYPNISCLGNVTEEISKNLEKRNDSKEYMDFLEFCAKENNRIDEVCNSLKKADITPLFSAMTQSCREMNIFLDIPATHRLLFEAASETDSICGYRYFYHGILSVVKNDDIDRCISALKNFTEGKYGIKISFCISGIESN